MDVEEMLGDDGTTGLTGRAMHTVPAALIGRF
jgi:hypothetical protein